MTVLSPVMAFVIAQRRRSFTLAKAAEATGHTRRQVLRALDRLVREGYVEELSDDPVKPDPHVGGPALRNPTWQVTGEKSLAERTSPKPRNTHRDRMWRIMRMRRQFTRTDLERLATTDRWNTELYTRMLERSGVIRRVGKQGREWLFLLVKDPGPARPRVPEDVLHG